MSNSPFELLAKIVKAYPAESDGQILERLRMEVRLSDACLDRLIDDWGHRELNLIRAAGKAPAAMADRSARSSQVSRNVEIIRQKYAKVVAKTVDDVFDTFRLLDGTLFADRQWFELGGLAQGSERQGKIIRACMAYIRPDDTSKRVRELLKPSDLLLILRQIDGANEQAA
jgi:hypothetical protein